VYSVTKARQAASHPEWIRNNLPQLAQAEIIGVLITPCKRTTKGAIPSLKQVRYWHLDDFRAWMKNALQVLRDIRRDFPGAGNLTWRTAVAEKLKSANIAPQQLMQVLVKTGAECMQVVTAKEGDE
jgi:hypothetical protein